MPLDTERQRSVLAPSRKGKGPSRGPKFIKNPAAKRLAQAVAGILAVAEANEAKPDEFQVGRPNFLDVVNGYTGNPLPGSPVGIGANTTVTGIQHIPEQGYSIMSVPSTTITDRLLRREDGSAVPTILPAPVNNPREIDYNPAEGKISVASQLSDEAVLLDAANPTTHQNYSLNGGGPIKGPVWTAFSQSGTPFLVSVDQADSKVRIYNPGGDLNGDGFPDDTTPTELVTLSLGSNALPDGAYYDRSNHVLYVICHNTRELWAFDIDDTSTATLAATQGQVVATFNFDPHDLRVTPNGTQLVVGGDNPAANLALINIGNNAAAASVQVPNLLIPGGSLGQYQAISFDSDGQLWVTQSNSQRATRIDTSGGGFSLTTDYIYFGGNQLGAFAIAQDPSVSDPDNDGDGVPASLDCNDTDASAWEESEFWVDVDGDLVGDDTVPSDWFCGATEAAASGYTATVGGDCDDGDATIFPGATEVCDGVDQNCVDGADEGLPPSDWYDDSGDEDDYGDPATLTTGCAEPTAPGLWVLQGGDCAPANSSAYPGAPEPSCGGPDLNCDETSPPACSGDTDGDGDGFTPDEGDCNDSDPTINPGAPEVCGGADEDCDGQENEGDAQDAVLLWTDGDGDGRGLPGAAELGCEGAPGTATQDGDCNDGDASVYPDAPEYADGHDKDCDTHPSAASGVAITDATDDTLIGNFSIPAANGPNYIKGLGQSFNVKFTQMARVYDEILDETQEFLGYQVVNSASNGTLTISREPGGLPVYVHQRPESAPADYIPTWTAAVTGTTLEALHQPNGITRLTVVEGTSVELNIPFYNDSDLWDAYLEANPGASGNLTLSGPDQWAEVDEDTGEITATNVQEIQDFLNFVDKYQKGDDDSGDDDTGDDDTQDDDDIGDDDTTPPEADDDETQGDDDSAGEGPDCEEGCNTFGKSPGKGHPIEAILIMLGLAGAPFRRRFRRSQSGSNLEAPAMIEELRGRVDLVARAANQNPGTATSSFRSAIARTMRGNRAIIKARRREQRNSA